ncbi:MAG: DUF4864 domain-containing protein [Paracoccaceae bacterium]
MRFSLTLGAFALALVMTGPQPATADAGTDIRSVIGDQFAAFAANDLGAAFDFASPTIKGIFRTPENFGQMVKGGYPMIWRPSEVKFLALRTENGRQMQRVLVRDGAGAIHLFDYEMIPAADGWQINGVFPVESETPTA